MSKTTDTSAHVELEWEPGSPEERLCAIFEEALAKMTPEQADEAIDRIKAIVAKAKSREAPK